MKSIIKKLSYLSVTFGSLLFPISVAAESTVINIEQPKGIGVTSVGQLLSAGFTVAVVLAALFVFVMLIMGGYAWITAGGDKAKVEEARGRITNAIIGLAIVAAAWALMTVISNFFGVDFGRLELPSAAAPEEKSGEL